MSRQDGNSTGVATDVDIDIDIELNPVPYIPSTRNLEREATPELSDVSVRQRFISKVYGVLTIQLCFTILLIKLFLFLVAHLKWQYFHSVILMSPVLLIPFCCCCCCWGNVKRKSPGNYILLMAFTLIEGSVLGNAVTEIRAPGVILFAGLIVTVTFSIFLFALQARFEFTFWRGIFMVFLELLFLNSLCAKFLFEIFPMDSITTASFFAFWFCLGLVCDTQHLLRNGGKDNELTSQHFIYVALTIHLDMFILFYLLCVVPSLCLMMYLTLMFPYGLH